MTRTFVFFLIILLLAMPVSPQAIGRDICDPQQLGESDRDYRNRRIQGNCEAQDQMRREAEKKWNKERQAKLKADTDKLLELATQLKQQVDKSNENVLSLDVIKKAEQIEKLAHSVQDKMKASSY